MVMTLVMYERLGFQERRPSPFSWRIRYAIAHGDRLEGLFYAKVRNATWHRLKMR